MARGNILKKNFIFYRTHNLVKYLPISRELILHKKTHPYVKSVYRRFLLKYKYKYYNKEVKKKLRFNDYFQIFKTKLPYKSLPAKYLKKVKSKVSKAKKKKVESETEHSSYLDESDIGDVDYKGDQKFDPFWDDDQIKNFNEWVNKTRQWKYYYQDMEDGFDMINRAQDRMDLFFKNDIKKFLKTLYNYDYTNRAAIPLFLNRPFVIERNIKRTIFDKHFLQCYIYRLLHQLKYKAYPLYLRLVKYYIHKYMNLQKIYREIYSIQFNKLNLSKYYRLIYDGFIKSNIDTVSLIDEALYNPIQYYDHIDWVREYIYDLFNPRIIETPREFYNLLHAFFTYLNRFYFNYLPEKGIFEMLDFIEVEVDLYWDLYRPDTFSVNFDKIFMIFVPLRLDALYMSHTLDPLYLLYSYFGNMFLKIERLIDDPEYLKFIKRDSEPVKVEEFEDLGFNFVDFSGSETEEMSKLNINVNKDLKSKSIILYLKTLNNFKNLKYNLILSKFIESYKLNTSISNSNIYKFLTQISLIRNLTDMQTLMDYIVDFEDFDLDPVNVEIFDLLVLYSEIKNKLSNLVNLDIYEISRFKLLNLRNVSRFFNKSYIQESYNLKIIYEYEYYKIITDLPKFFHYSNETLLGLIQINLLKLNVLFNYNDFMEFIPDIFDGNIEVLNELNELFELNFKNQYKYFKSLSSYKFIETFLDLFKFLAHPFVLSHYDDLQTLNINNLLNFYPFMRHLRFLSLDYWNRFDHFTLKKDEVYSNLFLNLKDSQELAKLKQKHLKTHPKYLDLLKSKSKFKMIHDCYKEFSKSKKPKQPESESEILTESDLLRFSDESEDILGNKVESEVNFDMEDEYEYEDELPKTFEEKISAKVKKYDPYIADMEEKAKHEDNTDDDIFYGSVKKFKKDFKYFLVYYILKENYSKFFRLFSLEFFFNFIVFENLDESESESEFEFESDYEYDYESEFEIKVFDDSISKIENFEYLENIESNIEEGSDE